jgi:hypothetical protein
MLCLVFGVAALLQHHNPSRAPLLNTRASSVRHEVHAIAQEHAVAGLKVGDWLVTTGIVLGVTAAIITVAALAWYVYRTYTSQGDEEDVESARASSGLPSERLLTAAGGVVKSLGSAVEEAAEKTRQAGETVVQGTGQVVEEVVGSTVAGGKVVAKAAGLTTPRAVVEFMSEDSCILTYDPVDLTSWKALVMLRGTIFTQRSLWLVLGVTLSLTISIALFIAYLVRAPESYDTEIISSVIKVVTIAMAFLLGLFVNNAMTRWWDIVKTFEALNGACKGLCSALANFDVSSPVREMVARRCVLSVVMLRFEQVVDKDRRPPDVAWKAKFDELLEQQMITGEERALLEKLPAQARSMFMWNLIGSAVKDLRSGGGGAGGGASSDPKAGKSTDYRTIYGCVQDGACAVSRLKSAASFHFPFLYVHMLAWMVHLVNLLTAVGAGITIGLLFATWRREPSGTVLDLGLVFKEILFLYIQVFLYQAFLSIGAALSFPIVPKGHGAMYRLPLAEMIEALRGHLRLINDLADKGVI